MIDELYINGTLIDIDNIEIPRKYVSPYFQSVDAWKNNSSYTVTLPWTTNNIAFFEHCFSEDMTSLKPYIQLYADYYCEGEVIFKNAEVKFLSSSEDGLEVQFVWGLNRLKYLSLFDTKLNEIKVNGTTITESDWIVNWRKDNVKYATGKKFVYLDYVSGERTSDVYTVGGVLQPAVTPPAPYNDNLKEMTQHPFIPFENILDLIIANATTEETLTANEDVLGDIIKFDEDISIIGIGSVVKTIDGNDVSVFNIRVIEIIDTNTIQFNQALSVFFNIGDSWVFAATTMASTEFDALKDRLTGKGIILGGDKGDKTFTKTKTFSTNLLVGTSGVIPLDNYMGSFYIISSIDHFGIVPDITGNNKSVIKISLNLSTFNDSGVDTKIYLVKNIDGTETDVYEFPYTAGGFQTDFDCEYEAHAEYGTSYFIRFENTNDVTILADSTVTISQNVQNALYSMLDSGDETVPVGYYDCLMNLPEMTAAEFIQHMLILTGLFFSTDDDGNLNFMSLDDLADNLLGGDVIDWSDSLVSQDTAQFAFGDFAQRNIIKYTNSDKVLYEAQEALFAYNETLEKEKDLYVLSFNLPERITSGLIEFILYKQTVESADKDGSLQITFKNEYDGKDSIICFDNSGVATLDGVLPNDRLRQGLVRAGFVSAYYGIFRKLIKQPLYREVTVNLDLFTSARIDFSKPVYIKWYGRYCVLLELLSLKNEPSQAKLLIIREDL